MGTGTLHLHEGTRCELLDVAEGLAETRVVPKPCQGIEVVGRVSQVRVREEPVDGLVALDADVYGVEAVNPPSLEVVRFQMHPLPLAQRTLHELSPRLPPEPAQNW